MKTVQQLAAPMEIGKRKWKFKPSQFKRQMEIQSMVWPGLLCLIIFSYFPMYGIIIAFKNYNVIEGFAHSPWVGLKFFKEFLTDGMFLTVLRNTMAINILGLLIGFPAPIIFALLINEMRNRTFKKITQTISYLPQFVSWIIYGGIVLHLLSVDTGVVNHVLTSLHIVKEPVFFLGDPKYFWLITVLTNVTKSMGWGAIIYIAAIAGVDMELYDAAMVDGAGRYRRMFYITLPSISSIIIIMLIFAISNIFSSGFDQIWILQNPLNLSTSETIDTYVYKIGLQNMNFSYATAVGLLRSVVAVLLLVGANFLSNKITDQGVY